MNPENPSSPGRLDAASYSADLPELQQARAFWVAHRLNESLRCYDRVVRLYPNHPVALIEAAVAFGNRFEIGRAEELLSRLLTATSELRFLMAAGNCYQSLGRLEEAIHCCVAALAVSPDHFEAHLKLSQLYERLNQLETGSVHAQHCLSVQPDSPEAIFSHGQLLRRMGELSQAEFSLKQLSENPNIPTAMRVSSGYQLGYLLDNVGRFDEAFKTVVTAKQLQQAEAADGFKKSELEVAVLEKIWQTVSESDFRRWEQESASLPTEKIAFLIGSPRSGTTLLERVLRAHPKISSTDEELFLPQGILPELLNHRDHRTLHLSDLNQLSSGQLKIARDRYFRYLTSVLREDSRANLHIDKNPSLIRLLPIILRLFPEAKLLFAIRDPRDLVVSCFLRQFPLNPISVEFLSLEQTARAVARDLELWQAWKQRLPNNWLEIRYEDMVTDLEATSRRTLEFLEVPWDASVLNFHQLTAPVNSPTYEAVAKPVFQHARGRWVNYERQLSPVLPILAPVLKQLNYR